MKRFVLDSNMWIKLLQKNRKVRARIDEALDKRDALLVSPVAYYEVTRGLMKRDDHESLAFIVALWNSLPWLDLQRSAWDQAARFYVEMIRRNQKREDADILLAASAKLENTVLVTDNVRHFEDMGVPFENWAA